MADKHWLKNVSIRLIELFLFIFLGIGCTAVIAGVVNSNRSDSEIQSSDLKATRIILLGTGGGPLSRKFRSEPATLLVVHGRPYLIDAGAGVIRQLAWAGYQPEQVRTIFITHHHSDHTAGLEPLMSIGWILGNISGRQLPKVQIYGPPYTKYVVDAALNYMSVSERIFNSDSGGHLINARDEYVAHDIDKNGQFYQDELIKVSAAENTHYHFPPGSKAAKAGDKSYAYRFVTPEGTVVFTGDTGPSDAVERLAKGADVLVSEVIDENAIDKMWRRDYHKKMTREVKFHMAHEHLTPQAVGKLASKAKVKLVILHHIGPGLDSEYDTTPYTVGVKKYYSGPVIAGKDLMEYDLYN